MILAIITTKHLGHRRELVLTEEGGHGVVQPLHGLVGDLLLGLNVLQQVARGFCGTSGCLFWWISPEN